MEVSNPKFNKYIFVCENERAREDCCGLPGREIRKKLKDLVSAKHLSHKIRVSRTGCLDVCSKGPNVLVMPDNVWYKDVHLSDVDAIIEKTVHNMIS